VLLLETKVVDWREEEKKRANRTSRATYGGPHMTHGHKLTRWLRSLGKAEADTEAETAETETARYPRVQKIQQLSLLDLAMRERSFLLEPLQSPVPYRQLHEDNAHRDQAPASIVQRQPRGPKSPFFGSYQAHLLSHPLER
jgi:hypothetical protein